MGRAQHSVRIPDFVEPMQAKLAFDMSHEEIRVLIGLLEKAPENCDSVNDVVDKHMCVTR
jgi:hypothetical protein